MNEKPNEIRDPSQSLPDSLVNYKKVKGMGMFAEIQSETQAAKSNSLIFTEDYSQGTTWASFLKNVPFLKRCLRCCSSPVSIPLNGLTHRGKRYYTLESCGICLCLLWLVMIIIAFDIVNPIFLNNLFRINIDEIELSVEDNHFNPSIKSFNEDSKIKV